MYKKVLTLTFLLLLNISLFAMDLNETTSIINEAEEATYLLQNEFDTLINEVLINQEIIEENSTITINELNVSEKPSCDELNTSTESNQSVEDNECIHTEIEGKSIRGLIIFKTRIKPVCEINGEAFAKQYMQEDWEDIYHDKEFKMEILKACPKIEKRYKDTWTPHLYQFSIEYASDSDAIPEC